MVKSMAREAHHLRHGQSRSGDHGRGGRRGPRRRHHGDRPLRLSEPDQQRARLSLHLPRRARRARHHHQHGDEDRRRPRARRARARGRARRGRRRLRGAAEIRARLHHPGAVRSAADLLRAAGGRARPRWTPASRASRSSTWTPIARSCARAAIRSPACCTRVFERLRRAAQARGVRRGRGGAGDPRRRELRAAGARQRAAGRARGPRARDRQDRRHRARQRHRDHQCAAVQAQCRLRRLSLRAAAAQGLPAARLPAPGQPGPQPFRRLHGGARRRRRHGHRRHPQFLRRARGRAAIASIPSPAIG